MIASLLPGFLLRRLAAGGVPGGVQGEPVELVAWFADLSGFTALAERLSRAGPGGDERITEVLNACFGRMIAEIHARGGEVLTFAGDALLAVWLPRTGGLGAAATAAAAAALAARDAVSALDPVDGVRLQVRIGIGAGEAVWMDVGGVGGRWNHLATGHALQQMGAAGRVAQPGEVVVSAETWHLLGEAARGRHGPGGFVRLEGGVDAPRDGRLPLPPLTPELEARAFAYIPEAVSVALEAEQSRWLAELRPLSVLFVSIRQLELGDPRTRAVAQEGLRTIQAVLGRVGGGVHKVTMDEKGVLVVAAFGLPPHSHEENAARAARAALEIQGALRDLRLEHGIGVTSGRAWCGLYGTEERRDYTIIAPVVNLAARLMQQAFNDIYCDDATMRGSRGWVRFATLPPVPVKGANQPVAVHRPLWGEARERRQRTVTRLGESLFLVGREEERVALAARVGALGLGGTSGAVLVVGEAGIGKSTLLADLLASCGEHGVTPLLGAGDTVDRATPYHAWAGVYAALLDLGRLPTREARGKAVLERLQGHPEQVAWAPLLNPVLGLDLPDTDATRGLSGAVRHADTIDLLVTLLADGAARGPLLVALDDGHWLDSASWELALQVVRRVEPLLLVIGTRPLEEPLPAPYLELRDRPGTMTLELGTLEPAAVLALVANRLGVREVPPAVGRLVVERAEGNPFFSEELVHALRDSGRIVVADGVCHLVPGPVDLGALAFPDTVHGLVTARLDRLPPDQQPTVKVASVIGRSFDVEVLRGVHPEAIALPELQSQLAAFARQQIALPEGGGQSWSFKHAITREAAYDLLPYAQRREFHLAVARWYEQRLGDLDGSVYPLLAWHYQAGADARNALDWLEKAGESAMTQGAHREAIHFLARARNLDDEASPELRAAVGDARRAVWAARLGEARLGLGDLDGALDEFRDALGRAGARLPLSGVARVGRLVWELGRQAAHLLVTPSVAPARAEVHRLVARVAALAGEVGYFRADLPTWALASLMSINEAERAGDHAVASRAYSGLANLVGTLRLSRLMARYLARARLSPDPSARMAADWAEAVWLLTFGRFADATRVVVGGVELGRRTGSHYELGIGLTIQGYLELLVRPHPDALATLRGSLQSARARANRQHEGWALTMMVPLLLGRGEVDEAVLRGEEAAGSIEARDPLSVPIIHGVRAQALARQELRREAVEEAERALVAFRTRPIAVYIFLPGLTGTFEVFLHQLLREREAGRSEQGSAEAGAREALALLTTFARVFPFARARRALHAGQLARVEGAERRARAEFSRAVALAEPLGLRWEAGRAHLELARLAAAGSSAREVHTGAARAHMEGVGDLHGLGVLAALG